ncbi:DUF1795 domain-containing protein [Actinacidiphila epipremni]|jgi:hypothetical protein|uniref:DUF1795 domain-containing protein n=1 Tax=Actinacidiphila epipremni TaxID=2053013 RepID=A0ABX0ZZZ2_9ACTN|nr:DUF1795 domain-containing protein [Actinacidiphila epipremni]NJP48086.1 DUF1795 domain-containing protein [Actinacidiphila epipremni]
MPTTLPLPIELELPDDWRAVPPDEAGAPGVAFAAVHPGADDGFTANITVDGDIPPEDATLDDIADGSVERMREVAGSVVLTERQAAGTADVPALTQQLSFTALAGGVRHALLQTQVYLALTDAKDPHRRAVIRLALTATAAQHDEVLPDFQDVVRSVRPDTRPPRPAAGGPN